MGEDFFSRAREIRDDQRSGAMALARCAAEALLEFSGQHPSEGELRKAVQGLVDAQPSMAPMVTLARRASLRSDRVAAVCREFLDELDRADGLIAQAARAVIPRGAIVLTHSFSQTVLAALVACPSIERVICTEARPVREGAALARQLETSGIRVTLIIDAAVAKFIGDATVVLVGADAVSEAGVTNKIGTRLIALAAREAGVPAYVLCSRLKFLPAGYRMPPEQPKPPEQIVGDLVPGVPAANYYFETTPAHWFKGIVTERGPSNEWDGV
jgi:translation initiation factor 2B subunit (eIF-2B alpha/beta/delta family)